MGFKPTERKPTDAGSGNFKPTERKPAESAPDIPLEHPTPIESIGAGFADVYQGLNQLYLGATDPQAAQQYTAQKTQERELYESGRGKDAGVDWWRIGGQAAALAPTMAISAPVGLAARTGLGALEGAAAGGAMFVEEGGSRTKQALIGGVAGGAAPVLFQGLSKVGATAYDGLKEFYKATGRKIDQFFSPQEITIKIDNAFAQRGIDLDSLPEKTRESISRHVKESLAATGKVDLDAAIRKSEFDELGFTDDLAPTTAQVSRDPIQWRKETSLSQVPDVGDELIYRQAAQKQKLADVGGDIAEGMGGRTKSLTELEQKAVTDLEKRWASTGKEVSRRYDIAATAKGADDFFPVDDLVNKVTPVLEETRLVEGIGKLRGQMEDIISGAETPTVKEMVQVRKSVSALMNSSDGNVRYAAGQFANAIDQAGATGKSPAIRLYNEAREAARKRFQEFGGKDLGKVSKGEAEPNKWVMSRIKGGSRDLQKVKKSLEKQDPLIWDDFKTEIVRDLTKKAVIDEGKFSYPKLRAAWESIPAKNKGLIFTPREKAQVEKFLRVAKNLTTAPEGAVRGSQTMPMLLDVINAMDRVPILKYIIAPISRPISETIKVSVAKGNLDEALAGKVTNKLDRMEAVDELTNEASRRLSRTIPMVSGIVADER
jgi:hypothetical protein